MSTPTLTLLCKTCQLEKDVSEFSVQKTSKRGYASNCKPCYNDNRRKTYKENPDIYERKAKYRAENSERNIEYQKEYREKNKEILLEKRSTPEKIAHKKALDQAYCQANPDKICAKSAKRRAWRLRATPEWADQESIKAFYTKAKQMQEETGIEYHVDHLVPLNSRFVSGLHCEYNLEVIPGSENCKKSNLWWPDMPDKLDYAELVRDYKAALAHTIIELHLEVAESNHVPDPSGKYVL